MNKEEVSISAEEAQAAVNALDLAPITGLKNHQLIASFISKLKASFKNSAKKEEKPPVDKVSLARVKKLGEDAVKAAKKKKSKK